MSSRFFSREQRRQSCANDDDDDDAGWWRFAEWCALFVFVVVVVVVAETTNNFGQEPKYALLPVGNHLVHGGRVVRVGSVIPGVLPRDWIWRHDAAEVYRG